MIAVASIGYRSATQTAIIAKRFALAEGREIIDL
jgi:hypothetical protein